MATGRQLSLTLIKLTRKRILQCTMHYVFEWEQLPWLYTMHLSRGYTRHAHCTCSGSGVKYTYATLTWHVIVVDGDWSWFWISDGELLLTGYSDAGRILGNLIHVQDYTTSLSLLSTNTSISLERFRKRKLKAITIHL